jgi:hypothetical protein
MLNFVFNSGRFQKNVKRAVENATKDVSEALFKDIVRRSPVRSGQFKRSWSKSGTGTRYKISNPQTYGGALERGRSRQAPRGVVKPAIKNLKTII